jgi:hypothetical protein
VPGAITSDLVRYAITKVEEAEGALPPSAPSPPPLPSPAGLPGTVIRVSGDGTRYLVALQDGRHVTLVSGWCAIHADDRVTLLPPRLGIASPIVVVNTTATASCTMYVEQVQ